MATSKFDLAAGYMKIFSPGSEHSNSAKRVEKININLKKLHFQPGLA